MNGKDQPPPYDVAVPQASVYVPPSQGYLPYPPQQEQAPYPMQQQPGYPQQQGHPQQSGYPQQPGYSQQPGFPQQQAYASVYEQPGQNVMAVNAAAGGLMKGPDFDYVGSDEPVGNMEGFSDKAVRRGFIRKVYGILMCQLAVTAGIIATLMFVEPVRVYCYRNMWPFITSLVMMIVCIIVLSCCDSVRRKSPGNFIVLGLFTICEGFLLGTVAGRYDTESVIIAVGITTLVVLALTLFAFQTKIDFTVCGGGLLVVLVVFILAGICMSFMPSTKWTVIGYGSAGAIIFSLYLIYDTQLMMGGKHKYSVSPEEYVFAALSLYIDIINMFMYILSIVGAARSD